MLRSTREARNESFVLRPSSFVRVLVPCVMALSPVARASTGDCQSGKDAPTPYDGYTCQGVCVYSSNTWTCDLGKSAACGSTAAYAVVVADYDAYLGQSASDYEAWGDCGGLHFCCAHVEDAGNHVDTVDLEGTSSSDTLYFNVGDGLVNLQPTHAHDVVGVMHGNGNSPPVDGVCQTEYLYGSYYVGSDYGDYLYGDAGCDAIYGFDDSDFLYGGDGSDNIFGGNGNDRIDGGLDWDDLYGEGGNDTICDTNETSLGGCVPNGYTYFVGSTGTDTFWYEAINACPAPIGHLSTNSTIGSEANEDCGDAGDWGALAWTGCDANISSKPASCPP